MKHANNISFFQRIRMKYKISVLNENTLEEVIHWRVSALRFVFWSVVVLLLILLLFSTLILTTPLRDLLPQQVDESMRKEVIAQTMLIDSLTEEVRLSQTYIAAFRDIVAANIAITDTAIFSTTIVEQIRDEKLMKKSEEERVFCEDFEKAEQYNIISSDEIVNPENLVFMKPVKGIITSPFSVTEGHMGVDLKTDVDAAILSVYQGVILFAGYNPQEGYIVQIVHPNNYISVYKGADRVLKKSGDIVKTGEVIATMGDNTTKNTLHFELWNGMTALDPTQYVVLE
jgi:hypothetical protein